MIPRRYAGEEQKDFWARTALELTREARRSREIADEAEDSNIRLAHQLGRMKRLIGRLVGNSSAYQLLSRPMTEDELYDQISVLVAAHLAQDVPQERGL